MPTPLQLHAARTRDAMLVDRGPQLAGRWTDTTWTLIRELTDLVAATHPRRLAEHAVTRWILERGPIARAILAELEAGDWEWLPVPQLGRQGFDQWTRPEETP